MLHSLAGRPENRLQAGILRLLRDEGPLSRAQLGERLEVSRTTVAAEVTRLTSQGLTKESGYAASRGGRRSTMVDLADDLRFVGISIGATGLSVAVTDGRQDGPLLPGAMPSSPLTQQLVDEEVRRIVDGAERDVVELLERERDRLEALAGALLERETLDQPEAYEVAGVEVPEVDVEEAAKATAGP